MDMVEPSTHIFTGDGCNHTEMLLPLPDNHSREMFEGYLAQLLTLDRDRSTFRYLYHILAVLIVISNVLVSISILVSRRQRNDFQCWLFLHVTSIQAMIGGCVCPFLGETLNKQNAGLELIPCKVLSFLSDVLNYMSNISLVILGVHQCVILMSPRMLNGVSRALLAAVMIIVPWFVCVMLTTVLRLTMSEEYLGDCYTISDLTAHLMWNILAYGVPFILMLVCCLIMLVVACMPFVVRARLEVPDSPNMVVFVNICLLSSVLMRAPFYFVYASPIDELCVEKNGFILCNRLTHSLDHVRLGNMILIPLLYLIPAKIKLCCRKMKERWLTRSTHTMPNNTKRTLEMLPMTPIEHQALV